MNPPPGTPRKGGPQPQSPAKKPTQNSAYLAVDQSAKKRTKKSAGGKKEKEPKSDNEGLSDEKKQRKGYNDMSDKKNKNKSQFKGSMEVIEKEPSKKKSKSKDSKGGKKGLIEEKKDEILKLFGLGGKDEKDEKKDKKKVDPSAVPAVVPAPEKKKDLMDNIKQKLPAIPAMPPLPHIPILNPVVVDPIKEAADKAEAERIEREKLDFDLREAAAHRRRKQEFQVEIDEDLKSAFDTFLRHYLIMGLERVLIEWREKIKKYVAPNMTRIAFDANLTKNRYKDMPCIDATRVVLTDGKGPDYINANHIKGDPFLNNFICTQAPLPHTISDFWRMCIQEKVTHIVMLCDLMEKGKKKCELYWPEKPGMSLQVGEYSVKNTGNVDMGLMTNNDGNTHLIEISNETGFKHILRHHNWRGWPDKTVPGSKLACVRFLKPIRQSTGPTVVHCSAGVGRTGTFVAIEMVFQELARKKTQNLDLLALVKKLRDMRPTAVQTELQYAYLIIVMAEWARVNQVLHPMTRPLYKKFDADFAKMVDKIADYGEKEPKGRPEKSPQGKGGEENNEQPKEYLPLCDLKLEKNAEAAAKGGLPGDNFPQPQMAESPPVNDAASPDGGLSPAGAWPAPNQSPGSVLSPLAPSPISPFSPVSPNTNLPILPPVQTCLPTALPGLSPVAATSMAGNLPPPPLPNQSLPPLAPGANPGMANQTLAPLPQSPATVLQTMVNPIPPQLPPQPTQMMPAGMTQMSQMKKN